MTDILQKQTRDDGGLLWMFIGLCFFGFLLGSVTGISTATGVSQTLVTALIAFIGGAFLTVTRKIIPSDSENDKPTEYTNYNLFGKGLVVFSLGTMLGVIVGIYARVEISDYSPPVNAIALSPAAASTKSSETTNKTPNIILHSKSTKLCNDTIATTSGQNRLTPEIELLIAWGDLYCK